VPLIEAEVPQTVKMNETASAEEGFADEAKAVEDFLKFLPERVEQYSRDCLVFNAVSLLASKSMILHQHELTLKQTTGRYEDAVGSNDTTNSGAASPLEGRRAPPPTPATVAAALGKEKTDLEVIPEDDTAALTVPSRANSPDPLTNSVVGPAPSGWGNVAQQAELTSSTVETVDNGDSIVVPTPSAASETIIQVENGSANSEVIDTIDESISKALDGDNAGEAFISSKSRLFQAAPGLRAAQQ
jgi:hypothetical protein